MKYFIILFSFLLVPLAVNAQPDTLWTRVYGTEHRDVARTFAQTSDGGFILAGSTEWQVGDWWPADVFVVRIDSMGDVLWSQTIEIDSSIEGAADMEITSGNECTILCAMEALEGENHTDWDFYLVRLDSNGDSLWTRRYDYDPLHQQPFALEVAGDGGYLMAGYEGYAGGGFGWAYVIRADADGFLQDIHEYHLGALSHAENIVATSDSGFLLIGWVQAGLSTPSDILAIKCDSNGDTLWSQTYGGLDQDYASSVVSVGDTEYVLAGKTRSFGAGGYDVYVLAINGTGDTLWTVTYGSENNDYATSIAACPDGGFIVCGVYDEEINPVFSDLFVLKLDSDGHVLWSAQYGGPSPQTEKAYDVAYGRGGYAVAGYVLAHWGGWEDMYFIRLQDDLSSAGRIDLFLPTDLVLSSYPNPFNPTTTISFSLPKAGDVSLKVYDVTGREVQTLAEQRYEAGEHAVTFDGSALPSGIYFAQMNAGTVTQTRKMVLLK